MADQISPAIPQLEGWTHPETFENPDINVTFTLEKTEYFPDVIVPVNPQGKMMSPFEASTGVVLPIIGNRGGKRNGHHPKFFKRWYESASAPLAATASRFARKQDVSIAAHNRYHDWVEGTLYAGEKVTFNTVNLELAGYVPVFGVDCRRPIPEVIELNNRQRKLLRRPGVFYPEKYHGRQAKICEFLVSNAITEEHDRQSQLLIEQFLSLPAEVEEDDDLVRLKSRLTRRIIRKFISTAVDDINKIYDSAYKSKALRFGAPACAFLVADRFIGEYDDYSGILETGLRSLVN